jgi:predicted nucleic acid-binding protein
MNAKYVLDACSLIAYYGKEEGYHKVKAIITEAASDTSDIFMHRINLYEVYYDLLRSGGESMTNKAMQSLAVSPVSVIDVITEDVMKEAARFKLSYNISVADSFALATAKTEKAMLVTSDHHEFDAIDKAGEIGFLWIR